MSFVLLGILNSQAAGAAQAYFLSVLGGASADEGAGVALDSSNNAYVLGFTGSTGAGSNDFLLAKYDTSFAVAFQRTLGGASVDNGKSVAVDSSDNSYVTGITQSVSASQDFLLAKYNSSGTIQWQRSLGGASNDNPNSIAVDSANNIYVVGETKSTGAGEFDFLIAKYNSSGTIQFQKSLGGVNREFGQGIAIDSANNFYAIGFTESAGAGSKDLFLAKYDSSGSIQWQRVLGGASSDEGKAVAVDSSDNIYVLAETESTGAGSLDFLLAKYDSSGTIQWQRVLGGASLEFAESIALDSSDNVYVLGWTNSAGAGSFDFLLAKYNSSGTIQWQRLLGGVGDDRSSSIAVDSLDNLYVLGFTESTGAGSADFLLAKLPNDGSLEGTYSLDGNNIIYQASSLTAATSSLTAATSSLTSATSSLTAATSTLTDAAASLTVVTEEIG